MGTTNQEPKEWQRLAAITNALEYARRVTGRPRLEVQQLQLVLTLFKYRDGLAMQDIAKDMGVDPSFVSRNSRAFGGQSKGKEIMMQRIDPHSPKHRLLLLTPAGRDIVQVIMDIATGIVPMPKVQRVVDTRVQG